MKLTKEEEKQLYEWGIKFFEMGWKACTEFMGHSTNFALPSKSAAIKNYIKEELKKK